MNNTIRLFYLKHMIAAALLAAAMSAEAGLQDIERANDSLMRQYLGREAERTGLISPDGSVDRTEAIEAGGVRGIDDSSLGIRIDGSYSPATDKRLVALFEKRKLRAAKGDVVAQLNLGLMYFKGEGTIQNFLEAAKWLQRPAEQGYADAQYALGEVYTTGIGLPKNFEEAAVWYRKAAEQGLEIAQYKIGIMYAEGYGVRYNAVEAEKWLAKAAEGGDAKMQFNLAERYANGQGVRFNPREAEKWYRSAAMQGDPDMQFFVGRLYRDPGDLVVQNREEAMAWFNRAAEKGHAASKASLGVMYLNGEGIPIDMVQAYKWLSLAATSSNDRGGSQKTLQIAEDKTFLEEIRGTSREYLKIAEERMSEEQIKEAKKLAEEWQAKYK
ncbi:MAG: SEL1-like repeat protein [Gallionellaceae bacterium]|nr:SEL1-like repeat protein [Gallionellaceae bacterium]